MSRLSYEQIVAAYLAVAVLTAVVVLLGVCAFRQRAAERGAPDALRRGDGQPPAPCPRGFFAVSRSTRPERRSSQRRGRTRRPKSSRLTAAPTKAKGRPSAVEASGSALTTRSVP